MSSSRALCLACSIAQSGTRDNCIPSAGPGWTIRGLSLFEHAFHIHGASQFRPSARLSHHLGNRRNTNVKKHPRNECQKTDTKLLPLGITITETPSICRGVVSRRRLYLPTHLNSLRRLSLSAPAGFRSLTTDAPGESPRRSGSIRRKRFPSYMGE